ncbi:MAG: amylo-alpha-1,6-glucosidase [Myxococcota bacterium]
MSGPEIPIAAYGRPRLGDFDAAERMEWLVTNGIGGYASGAVSGGRSRGYHGVLVAALAPPLGRTLTVTGLDLTAHIGAQAFSLTAHRWNAGTPTAPLHLERFSLEGRTPVWRWAFGDAVLEQRIAMVQGANTTCVVFKLVRGSSPVSLSLKAFGAWRDFHHRTHSGDPLQVAAVARGVRVTAPGPGASFVFLSSQMAIAPCHVWYRDFALVREGERGFADVEDALCFATASGRLSVGESVAFIASTEDAPRTDAAQILADAVERDRRRLAQAQAVAPAPMAPWVARLVLAADAFLVDRSMGSHDGKTVLAGYPWFGDWGRDTMISLPGLTLATGRTDVAADVLQTYAQVIDGGMLPNRFPDDGDAPEYNTVDASLWYFEAIRATHAATGDDALIDALHGPLAAILQAHVQGTRYGIGIDPTDGLLRAGEDGVQLTWMDARIGERVITPRMGKPVEINALWLNALRVMIAICERLDRPAAPWRSLAEHATASFSRFWNPSAGICFDVLDGPDGDDPRLRPNQIFAVSLGGSPLTDDQQRAIVARCGQALLTSAGLRSLDPHDAAYRGVYAGDAATRDGRYHQGTVWGWLIGPYARAHYRVYRDATTALSFLTPMAHHLDEHGLGSLAEIFDGDPPFRPRGCIAQAWSVAQVLWAWQEINRPV